MIFELEGKVIEVLPEVSGEGKNGKWVRCDFVIEVPAGQYPQRVLFSAWQDKVEAIKQFQKGEYVKVAFSISAKEFNGRWFNDVRAIRIEKPSVSTNVQQPVTQQNAGHTTSQVQPPTTNISQPVDNSTTYVNTYEKDEEITPPTDDDLPF